MSEESTYKSWASSLAGRALCGHATIYAVPLTYGQMTVIE